MDVLKGIVTFCDVVFVAILWAVQRGEKDKGAILGASIVMAFMALNATLMWF